MRPIIESILAEPRRITAVRINLNLGQIVRFLDCRDDDGAKTSLPLRTASALRQSCSSPKRFKPKSETVTVRTVTLASGQAE